MLDDILGDELCDVLGDVDIDVFVSSCSVLVGADDGSSVSPSSPSSSVNVE